MKLVHFQSREILSRMCEEILTLNREQRRNCGVYTAIFRAIKEGIFEFVFEIIRVNPDLIWTQDDEDKNIFSAAVLYRRAKIYSLIYSVDLKNVLTYDGDTSFNNMLHMAGKLAGSTQLNRIPGAALQMQRELQWFKVISLTSYFSVAL